MVDGTGKIESKKASAPVKGRSRGLSRAGNAKPAVPVLPPLPAEPEVPSSLAAVAPNEPAPVVEQTSPDSADSRQQADEQQPVERREADTATPDDAQTAPVAAAPVTETPYEPAAPAASFEKKEANMNETVTSFAEKAQEQTKTAFANVGEQTRGAVEKSRKVAEDMAEFGKGNVEAMVESARIAAQAIETMGQEAASFARARYDSTAQMIQTLASVKSPAEMMQIQADYFRSSLDALVKEASRSTEATMKLAGDVAKPLQNRMAVAGDKFRTAG